MGGMKNRDQKRKNAHVYSSGGGGGSKGPAVVDKRNQELNCPHCDRVFKQPSRLQEHIKKQHATEIEQPAVATEQPSSSAATAAAASSSNGNVSTKPQQKLMDVGSKSGYYDAKTPKMLLHEWLLRVKQPKARYKASEQQATEEGQPIQYRCKVVLPHPKNSNDDVVLFLPASLLADSEDEAMQRAAVMGLHHVAGDRAMERLLPSQYVELWKYLTEEKKKKAERDEVIAARKSAQEAAKKAAANRRERGPSTVIMTEDKRQLVENILREGRQEHAASSSGHPVMAPSRSIDNLSSSGALSSATSLNSLAENGDGSGWSSSVHSADKQEVIQELIALGFTEKDAILGADNVSSSSSSSSSSLSDVLDWLCMNIPESRLPKYFAPGAAGAPVKVLAVHYKNSLSNNSSTGHSQAAGDHPNNDTSSVTDPAVRDLAEYGYPTEWCIAALAQCHGHVHAAARLLYSWLTLSENGVANNNSIIDAALGSTESVEEQETDVDGLIEWHDEGMALQAIFDNDIEFRSPNWTVVRIPLADITELGGNKNEEDSVALELHAFAPLEPKRRANDEDDNIASSAEKSCWYPQAAPVLAVQSIPLGAVSFGALRALIVKLHETSQGLLGSPMIFDLVTAAAELLPTCIAHPLAVPRNPPGTSISNEEKDAKIPATKQQADTTVPRSNNRRRDEGYPKIDIDAESRALSEHWKAFNTSTKHASMRQSRGNLPAYKQRSDVIQAVTSHSVTVVSGATGCGKSTQVPQYLLEHAIDNNSGGVCNIIITQPRRISAVGLANRVAAERGEKVGDVVGYSVRLDSKRSKRTRLLFCTTGVLLRRLVSDPSLVGTSHVVLDEVHERSIESDLLLMLLRKLLQKRANPQLKVVLMSATADANLFANYFVSILQQPCAILTIPGFTHPVTDLFLEDAVQVTGFVVGKNSRWAKAGGAKRAHNENTGEEDDTIESRLDNISLDSSNGQNCYSEQTQQTLATIDESLVNIDLIESLVAHIASDIVQPTGKKNNNSSSDANAILIFVPGADDISRIVRTLESSSKVSRAFNGSWKIRALPLHGGLPPAQQSRVFERPPPGVLKIVVSTNVAETSITIDDITCVIDTGRAKEMGYDSSRGIARLQETWISQAAAKQRRGRAGRVRPGICYRLFSRKTWNKVLAKDTPPEVARVTLQALIMDVKGILRDADVASTLREMITPPESNAIDAGVRSLELIGALDPESGLLTPLGRHLTQMPCDPRIGKMLIYGAMLRCLDPVLTVAAAQGFGKPVFWSTPDKREEAEEGRKELTQSVAASKSDHLAIVAAFNGWKMALERGGRRAASEYCTKGFVSEQAMDAIAAGRAQYADILADLGFISPGYLRSASAAGNSDISGDPDEMSGAARVVKAAICAGLYPQLLRVEHPKAKYQKVLGGTVEAAGNPASVKFFDRERGRVFLHPSSINFTCGKFESGWLAYSELVQTSKVFVRECSMVPVYATLLFGGDLTVHHEQGLVRVDNWATFKAPARIAVLVRELRSEAAALLQRKIEDPGLDISKSRVVLAMHHLLSTDGF